MFIEEIRRQQHDWSEFGLMREKSQTKYIYDEKIIITECFLFFIFFCILNAHSVHYNRTRFDV